MMAMVGLIALSVTVAHAGGGQGGGSNVIFPFQCYLINGDPPPGTNSVLNIADQFGARQDVHVGPARLLCTPTETTKPDGSLFDPPPVIGDHLTCYIVSPFVRQPSGRITLYDPDAVVDLNDELNTDRGVKVSFPTFLCTSSDKTCVSGANCPLPPPTP